MKEKSIFESVQKIEMVHENIRASYCTENGLFDMFYRESYLQLKYVRFWYKCNV